MMTARGLGWGLAIFLCLVAPDRGQAASASRYPIGFVHNGDAYFGWSQFTHMQRIRAGGFSIIQPESQALEGGGKATWKRMEPVEGQMDWTSLDLYLSQARSAGLQVFLALQFSFPPDWVRAKYPDARVCLPDGTPTEWQVCFAHPGVRADAARLMGQIAQRYQNHSAVIGYIIGDEIGLSLGGMGDLNYYGIDFGSAAQAGFRQWLEEKYQTISALNQRWATQYQSFAEISMAKNWFIEFGTHRQQWLDLTEYRYDYFADFHRALYEAIKAIDPAKRVMISQLHYETPYRIAHGGYLPKMRFADVYGTKAWFGYDSIGSGVLESRLIDAQGLFSNRDQVWFSNFNSVANVGGPPLPDYFSDPDRAGSKYVRETWYGISRGVKGIFYFLWTYAANRVVYPEMVFFEPRFDFGEYQARPQLAAMERNNQFLATYGDWFNKSRAPSSPIAVVDPELTYRMSFWQYNDPTVNVRAFPIQNTNQSNDWADFIQRCSLLNHPVDVVAEQDLVEKPPDAYKVLVLVGNTWLQASTQQFIRDRFAAGGHVIVSSDSGQYDADNTTTNLAAQLTGQSPGRVLVFSSSSTNAQINDFLTGAQVRRPAEIDGDVSTLEKVAVGVLSVPETHEWLVVLVNRQEPPVPLSNLTLKVCPPWNINSATTEVLIGDPVYSSQAFVPLAYQKTDPNTLRMNISLNDVKIVRLLPKVTLNGQVILDDYSGSLQDVCVKIEFRQGGLAVRTERLILRADGTFSIPNMYAGIYDIAFKTYTCLQKVLPGVDINDQPTNLEPVHLINGDTDGDNEVTSSDLATILHGMNLVGDP